MEISEAQKRMHQIALDQGFNMTDVPKQFMFLVGEVAEAFEAWRKDLPDYAEELADIANNVFRLAEMTGIDLDKAIEAKQEKVAQRTYVPLSNGALVKDEPGQRDREMRE
jgi:NTP pyrophosphatase (non-canonical NTP hydrolase)